MPRALITGIHGFVGSHLAGHLLERRWEVFGFDLRAEGVNDNFFQGDITDREALKHALDKVCPDIIFHLAGAIKSPHVDVLYNANLLGMVSLLDQVVESNLHPVVVVAGSSAVYGLTSGATPINERMKLRPVTHYAVSKAAQETAALRYYQAYGLPVMVLRMFNLLGPGQPADLACSAFARQIALAEVRGGNEIVTGNLGARRDFLDVRDAVRAFGLAAEKGKPGQIYNVCSGRAVRIRDCLNRMISMSPRELKIHVDPERAQKNDVPVQVGSSQKFTRLAGWRPQISLEQSLLDLLNDWRQRVKMELE